MHAQTLHALRLYQGMHKERFRPLTEGDAAECADFENVESVESTYRSQRRIELRACREARVAMNTSHKVCESHPMRLAAAQGAMLKMRDYRRAILPLVKFRRTMAA
jgi:hypothetical protein